jgi:hypothetical protein
LTASWGEARRVKYLNGGLKLKSGSSEDRKAHQPGQTGAIDGSGHMHHLRQPKDRERDDAESCQTQPPIEPA